MMQSASNLISVEQHETCTFDVTANWNPLPSPLLKSEHIGDVHNSIKLRHFVQQIGLDPVFVVPADVDQFAGWRYRILDRLQNVLLESVEVILVAAMPPQPGLSFRVAA
jgi:hypothetical protein